MSIKILSDEIIINLIILSSKKVLNDPISPNSCTVFDAFEGVIIDLYRFGQGHNLIASNVDSKRFRASIYSYLRHGVDLCHSVRKVASIYYRNISCSDEKDTEFIFEVLTAEAECTEAICKNEKETEAIRKILGHQPVVSRMDKIRPLLTYAKNHGSIDVLTYVSLFNYGYILGKRAERARRKGGAAI